MSTPDSRRPRPLLVIYTGGTLGMQETPRGLAPGGNIEARLARALRGLPAGSVAELPAYELLSLSNPIDSSAATPADWSRLAAIIAARYRDHAGIVVLHGTDTLAWSAASLAYQLQGIDRPVVLTGAMKPLEAPDSDAAGNVALALRFAANPALQEIAIAFGGRLLRGVCARKWHTRDAIAFESPNAPLLGEQIAGTARHYPEHGLDQEKDIAPRFELPDYAPLGDGGVARIALWPGISTRQLAAWFNDPRLKGALFEVWGAGNLPHDPALLEQLTRASADGKLIAAISQCPHGTISPGDYAAGQGLTDAGVLAGGAMTPEAALTKLVHLLAQPLEDAERRRRFLAPLVGER
ncbi:MULTISPECIES: asparaginase [unclassified Halomonas]|uniref:asparaginase n=1 Tax=unclassified Halomonas TaxID=2609666 RepID=UPI0028884D83|nr:MULTISPECIES: asparaginase [unclassified Halomonas]MDT0499627.1 asparaginase [Halomonas sp. PAR7]MDT0510556.1 asparaginase [Halomonas sp. LES1]MDT0592645.1 asparaginase [Halomonas sp. PAR8]